MGGVCGIGSIKGRLSPIESLSGTLSIPVGGILDCDIYDGEYTVTPSDTVQKKQLMFLFLQALSLRWIK